METEAYSNDPASHFLTRPRTAAMMGSTHGRIYIYRIYGVHRCLNVTTDACGPGAVLFRALEPLRGGAEMARRRGGAAPTLVASGPARLFVALGLTEALQGARALDAFRFVRPDPSDAGPPDVVAGPRVGITKARDLPWRFHLRGNPHVSRGPAGGDASPGPETVRHGTRRRPAADDPHRGDAGRSLPDDAPPRSSRRPLRR